MTSSAERKLLRGVEHLKTFRGEAQAFEDDTAYVFGVEAETESGKEIKYRCYARERRSPPEHWPLLAGEAIQNLRSALDHAVWTAWRSDSANVGEGDHTAFPAALDPDSFKSQAGKALVGVPDPVRTVIENAQPYRTTPTAPAMDRLYILHTLSNIDKHRFLSTVSANVNIEHIGVQPDIHVRYEKFGTNTPLGSGETEVSAFTAFSETEFRSVDVQPGFSYHVRIQGIPHDMLVGIAHRVFEIVTELETGKPLDPFAAYPIYAIDF